MLRSTLHLVTQLSDRLLQLPDIVRQFEGKSPRALAELMTWINRVEELFSTHRMVEAAEVAGFKARILAPAFDDDKRGTVRRRQQTVAISLLYELQEVVQQGLRPRATRVQQGRDLANQLLQIVAQSGAVHYDPAYGIETMVDQVWALCIGHEQLKPISVQLRTLLSNDDIRLLLAEEIDPLDFL
jgi:hypothetical protein